MMRTRWSLLALCFAGIAALAACGDDDGNNNPDLSAAAQACGQVVTCAQGCNANEACAKACGTKGTPTAQMKYGALVACAYTVCQMPGDGGAAACASATDTSMGCAACLGTAAATAACSTQLNACLADK